MDCLATADSIQTSKSQRSPSKTWMMEFFAILDDPPMSESAKNLLVLKSHLPKTCKLWLYQHFIVVKMSWHFTALDLTATFVKTLQSVSTKFLKN